MIELIDERINIMQNRLADLQSALQALRDLKTAVEARVLTATAAQKALAVSIHTAFCTKVHGSNPGECTWNNNGNADNPATADWTEAAHVQWLSSTQDAIQHAKDTGWTVEEPAP